MAAASKEGEGGPCCSSYRVTRRALNSLPCESLTTCSKLSEFVVFGFFYSYMWSTSRRPLNFIERLTKYRIACILHQWYIEYWSQNSNYSGGTCESLFPCLLSMGIAARSDHFTQIHYNVKNRSRNYVKRFLNVLKCCFCSAHAPILSSSCGGFLSVCCVKPATVNRWLQTNRWINEKNRCPNISTVLMSPLILTWVARVRLNDAHNSGYSKVQPRVQVVNDPLCGIRPQVINWEGASYKGCTSLFRDRGVLIFCSNYKFHWSLFIHIKSSQPHSVMPFQQNTFEIVSGLWQQMRQMGLTWRKIWNSDVTFTFRQTEGWSMGPMLALALSPGRWGQLRHILLFEQDGTR